MTIEETIQMYLENHQNKLAETGLKAITESLPAREVTDMVDAIVASTVAGMAEYMRGKIDAEVERALRD